MMDNVPYIAGRLFIKSLISYHISKSLQMQQNSSPWTLNNTHAKCEAD